MNIMEILHTRMSRHVVTIKIEVTNEDEDETYDVGVGNEDETSDVGVGNKYETYDGTVLSSQLDCLYIIASSEFRDKIDNSLIQVQLPNNNWITIERDCFDLAPKDEDSGIIGIRCTNPTPGLECGFGDLDPIDVCDDLVQELQSVYTYSHHSERKLLTPGSIMLVEEGSFDHNCARYLRTHKGAPVVNVRGQFVGFCFSHKGYLTSYNMREVAAKIERNQGRPFTRISVTFQHLRQQCRVIEFRLRGDVVHVKIQRIGQPVTSASWENLEEFRQQHPAFQVEEEIEHRIQWARQQAVANRKHGLYYVRDKQRSRFSF